MARSRKLTPTLLKRIIAEEKRKLNRQLRRKNSATTTVQRDIKKSRSIKNEQIKLVRRLKKLQEARRILKRRIMRKM